MTTILILAAWAAAFWISTKQQANDSDNSIVMMDERLTVSVVAFFLLLWNFGAFM